MAKFIDHHVKMPPMPPEFAKQAAGRIKAGKADEFGVKGLNVFIGKDGQGWCLSEGPNADAVVKSHKALGFPLDRTDVTEVSSLV